MSPAAIKAVDIQRHQLTCERVQQNASEASWSTGVDSHGLRGGEPRLAGRTQSPDDLQCGRRLATPVGTGGRTLCASAWRDTEPDLAWCD